MKCPPLRSHVGDHRCLTYPNGYKEPFTITDEIQRPQTGAEDKKIICLQRVRFDDDNREEVRLGYFVIGKKPKMLGRWVWGQYATFMPLRDFKWIIRQAEEKGWF